MVRTCDLHTHSVFSDGSLTPAQLVQQAEEAGLSAIALTDHNTVAGLPEFLAAGAHSSVETVPGIELSTDWKGKELHLVGLFVRPSHEDAICAYLSDFARRKEASNRALMDALAAHGYPLDYAGIREKAGGYINRAHIAMELVAQGYVPTVKAAFSTLLSEKHGLYQPPERIAATEAVAWFHEMGIVTVLAHPYLSLSPNQLEEFIPAAKARGLDAMETLYSTYDEATSAAAAAMADRFGLCHSGGSDFHGNAKPDIRLGTGKGGLQVPLSLLEQLRSRI